MGALTTSEQTLYGPGSLTWRLSRERVLLLGGPRALVLQVAHPLVAAGVADLSKFRSDPLLRLRRTLDSTLSLIFGSAAQARVAADRINAAHRAVHGVLPQDAGRFTEGTPYDATDPDLLLWVHATLVDTMFAVYTRFVEPLDDAALASAYEESKVAARTLGVPDDRIPRDVGSFRRYVDGMLVSNELAAAPFQREIVRDVLYPPLRFVPRALHRPSVAVTTASLPSRIRELFELDLTTVRRRGTDVLQRVSRSLLPLMPSSVRFMSQARSAYRRTR